MISNLHEQLVREQYSRAPEFYGFVAWTSTYLLFCVYILWAFLPTQYIEDLGLSVLPNREWAVLVPAWSVVTVLLTYIGYWALALAATPSFDEMGSIADGRASLPSSGDKRNPYAQSAQRDVTSQLYDVPIGMVNRVAYRKVDEFHC